MRDLRRYRITIEYENEKYRLLWIGDPDDGICEVGVQLLTIQTMGIPVDTLFAEFDGQRIKIVGKWGKGEIYARLYEKISDSTSRYNRVVNRLGFLTESCQTRELSDYEREEMKRLTKEVQQ